MIRGILLTVGALVVGGVTVMAQTPQPPSSPTQVPAPQSPAASQPSTTSSAGGTVTFIGCLSAWDASMGATSGAVGSGTSTASGGQFVLRNVQDHTMEHPSVSGGTPDTSRYPGSGSTNTVSQSGYLLKAQRSSMHLNQYLNQKVQVTGVLENGITPATPGRAGATSPQAASPVNGSALQTFTVTRIEMVASSCR